MSGLISSHFACCLTIFDYKYYNITMIILFQGISGRTILSPTFTEIMYGWGCENYCRSCTVCGRNKLLRHRPYGLLKPLPIPGQPWDRFHGFTAILVVIDWASKQGIFVPTYNTITSEQLAQLFILHVFSKHGIPNHVTSDHGSEFVSKFMQALGQALNMEFHYIIQKLTVKQNKLTRLWNNTFASTVPINKITGLNYYHLLNSPITMHRMLLPV